MKAIVYRRYGPPGVLRLEEIEKPVPGEKEVLIRVRAASLNPLDWHFLRGTPYGFRMMCGLRTPKQPTLGMDVAGVVEATGRGTTTFQLGDAVFGVCHGAFAEYACAEASTLAGKPESVTFEEAASAPIAAFTALQALRDKGGLQAGQTVLINGAAGGVGTFAIQIARWLGAEVTGVCSARNLEFVRSLGASHAIDYTREDFTNGERRYDLILDCVGNHPLMACRRAMKPRGRCILIGGPKGRWVSPMDRFLCGIALSRFVGQSFLPFGAKANRKDLTTIAELLASGTVRTTIDRRYRLDQVPEAIRYLEEGHARGKIIVAM